MIFKIYKVATLLGYIMLNGCAIVAAYPSAAISLGTTAVTGKDPVEHAVSGATKSDCQFLRVFEGQPACQKELQPHQIEVVDKTRKVRIVEK